MQFFFQEHADLVGFFLDRRRFVSSEWDEATRRLRIAFDELEIHVDFENPPPALL